MPSLALHVFWEKALKVENAKTKVFHAKLPDNLQAIMNDWLAENNNIHLITTMQSSSSGGTTVTFLYLKNRGVKVAKKKA